jgi:hypothetical protein
MDDQSVSRECGISIKRPRFSLRVALLVVALAAAVFTWIATKRNAYRAQLRSEIKQIELMRKAPTADAKDQKRMFGEIDAEVAKRRKLLGEEN